MEENTQNKIGTFVSSAVNRIISIVMILVIIALVALVAYFWHNNELLKQKNIDSQEKIEKFEEMNNQAGSRDVVIKENIEEKVSGKESKNMEDDDVVLDKNSIVENKVITNEKVYFEVKELGVKFLVNKELLDKLTYAVIDENSVNFSTKKLNSIKGSVCDKNLARMTKIKGTANNDDPYEKPINMNSIKQFNNYYVQISGPQVSCSSDDGRVVMNKNEKENYYKMELEILNGILDNVKSLKEI
ncbi:MAG: hypothetical protein KAT32_03730 [Candidatus Moranbacteria bacterium]|nr:hypothetical protein [Candidatus Moranbacteria bacterium]